MPIDPVARQLLFNFDHEDETWLWYSGRVGSNAKTNEIGRTAGDFIRRNTRAANLTGRHHCAGTDKGLDVS